MANPPRDQQTPENEDPDLDQDESDLPDETLAIEPIVEEVDESEFALPEPGKEEELRLVHDFQTTGNRDSAVKLILSNLRVSVSIAAEYFHSGADQLDLIQEGNVGLMQAIRKFDASKGVRFYSYAAWWVRA